MKRSGAKDHLLGTNSAVSHKSFRNSQALGKWMADNHASAKELWIRIYKSALGKPSVTWADCVVEAIRYGWIDGQKKALDDSSFLQRLSPRKPGSNWSSRNREHARKLIQDGRMLKRPRKTGAGRRPMPAPQIWKFPKTS